MKKKFVSVLLGILGLVIILVLTSCRFDVSAEIYLRDIYDYVTGAAKDFSGYGIFNAELSKEYYDTYESSATQIAKKYFSNLGNVRYENSGYTADIEITTNPEHIFYFTVQKDGTLALFFNNEKFDALNKELGQFKESYMTYSLSREQMSITLTFVNDLKKPIKVVVAGAVYVNNEPCPFSQEFTLKTREKLKITFTDVLRDYLTKRGSTPILKIYW